MQCHKEIEKMILSTKDGTSYMVCTSTWSHFDNGKLTHMYNDYKTWLFANESHMTKGEMIKCKSLLHEWEDYIKANA
jgi:hypothetical protein